jgi:uncharacterized membrane protein YraQ (UPF0718 family)
VNWRKEWKPLSLVFAGFLVAFYLPVGRPRFDGAVHEALALVKWYAREHVLLCLVPAFFIAGAISVFVSSASVMKYLGVGARKVTAYGVAAVSGTVLAVCSCTVLPLFAGIYRMGAGLGPATAFLYSGPAINVLAIILTARILGLSLGVGRAVGAIAFSVVIGLLMQLIFRREEQAKAAALAALPPAPAGRRLWKTALYFASMIAVLVFATWGRPTEEVGFWYAVHDVKWILTTVAATVFGVILVAWFALPWWKLAAAAVLPAGLALIPGAGPLAAFAGGIAALVAVLASEPGELRDWLTSTWDFTKQILPLLLGGVLVAGFLLGRPGGEGVVPSAWVAGAVGGNSLGANLFASVAGALMYFATLTEVPILQGLLGSGMGQGPALALLLAGPALSLPSIIVLRGILGWRKTLVYVGLVVVMSTITGLIFGALAR